MPPGAMLVSEDHITAEAMLIQGACAAAWDHGDIWARLLPMPMSESMILPQQGCVMLHVTHVATEDHTDSGVRTAACVHELRCYLGHADLDGWCCHLQTLR